MDSVYEQARTFGAEIVVGMRETGLPEGSYPDAVRIVDPRGTLPSLRAAALRRSRGGVIAMTEDHCRVRPDWCGSVLAAHAEYPQAMVIIGCVENTACNRWSEWGAYLLGNGAFMAPLAAGPYTGAVTGANVSFKRRGIPEELPQRGWTGDWHAAWLRERAATALLHPAPVVDHELVVSMREAFVLFYRDARASAAVLGEGEVAAKLLGALWGVLCSPFNALRTALRVAVHKGRLRAVAIAGIPAVASLIVAHNLGVAHGVVSGPGDAPDLLY